MKEKRNSLRFAGRQHSKKGVTATVIGCIGWLIFLGICLYSSTMKGSAAMFVGIIGILDAFFSLAGIGIAIRGFSERDVYYELPSVGIILNGILFVVYFSLYFMGTALI